MTSTLRRGAARFRHALQDPDTFTQSLQTIAGPRYPLITPVIGKTVQHARYDLNVEGPAYPVYDCDSSVSAQITDQSFRPIGVVHYHYHWRVGVGSSRLSGPGRRACPHNHTAPPKIVTHSDPPQPDFEVGGVQMDALIVDRSRRGIGRESGEIATEHWDFGDGTSVDQTRIVDPAEEQPPTVTPPLTCGGDSTGAGDPGAGCHAYQSHGTYTITLTVTDTLGKSATVSHSVTV